MTWTLVSPWVVIQVQLMVLLSIPPLSGLENLRRHPAFPPLLIDLVRDFARDFLLLCVVEEDCAAVLSAHIRALAVFGGRVVHAVKEFDEGAVLDLGRVVYDLESLGVWNKPQKSNQGKSRSGRVI